MVRLADLPKYESDHLLSKACPPFDSTPWVEGPPLAERRVALVTTSGLHSPGQATFYFQDSTYRVIPGDTTGRDLVMSHSSVNFDRTGFQQDVNVVFPIDRLRELQAAGEIGSLADYHYAFMGANLKAEDYESSAKEVAGLLKEDRVNAVLFTPV
ncbi:MAG: selenoprotein B glycine/betaine/sarcosine/D-proline reductase [Rhodospirillales bacterium]|nr:selenoprotein B glycine/betaine/sarcosine/D-proline reductase [Rhodospirillales bacterium]